MTTLGINWTMTEAAFAARREREDIRVEKVAVEIKAEKSKPDVFELARRIYDRSRLQRRYRRSGSII